MPYGLLTNKMRNAVAPLVKGKTVWDLGAGDLGHARTLLELGAALITAIDKEPTPPPRDCRIAVLRSYFDKLTVPDAMPIEVAFVAWPQNHPMPGLIPLLEASEVVIYLGSNTDGAACAWPPFFEHMLGRELLAHVPRKDNSLIAVGKPLPAPRPKTPEEYAALHERMQSFSDLSVQMMTLGEAVEATTRVSGPSETGPAPAPRRLVDRCP